MHLSGGPCHDAPEGRKAIAALGGKCEGVPIVMDRADEGNATRELAKANGHKPIVPPKSNRVLPWEYDRQAYKKSNVIERLFRRLKAFRRICTRYDKTDVMFMAYIQLALSFIYLN
jgi:transposase